MIAAEELAASVEARDRKIEELERRVEDLEPELEDVKQERDKKAVAISDLWRQAANLADAAEDLRDLANEADR